MLDEAPEFESTAVGPYQIRLDVFEGPLDLLLHLIKENKLDIYDIPIAKVTAQYLETLDMMKELNLEVAGEFLLMAATLAHIKSKLLLPPDESQEDPEEEGVDPRADLVRRLLEYQKYKNAADQISSRPLLLRDVFKRERSERSTLRPDEPAELLEVSVFKLVEAFHKILKKLELEVPHDVQRESISVGECVKEISLRIRGSAEGAVNFRDLFETGVTRLRMVATFLAVLEMIKRGFLRIFQAEAFSEIQLMGTPTLYGEWTYDGTDEYSNTPRTTETDS